MGQWLVIFLYNWFVQFLILKLKKKKKKYLRYSLGPSSLAHETYFIFIQVVLLADSPQLNINEAVPANPEDPLQRIRLDDRSCDTAGSGHLWHSYTYTFSFLYQNSFSQSDWGQLSDYNLKLTSCFIPLRHDSLISPCDVNGWVELRNRLLWVADREGVSTSVWHWWLHLVCPFHCRCNT